MVIDGQERPAALLLPGEPGHLPPSVSQGYHVAPVRPSFPQGGEPLGRPLSSLWDGRGYKHLGAWPGEAGVRVPRNQVGNRQLQAC